MKKTFDVLGSCVSRDLFSIPEAVNFDCGEYIARHSILSLMASPFSVEEGELDALTSNFQREMVLNNLRKTTLNKLKASKYLDNKQSHIIIHEARMVDRYIGKDGEIHTFASNIIENNKRLNFLLDKMYMWLKDELPRGGVIDITSTYLADENHKWGLSPMHYQIEYYQNAIKEIEKIVYENKLLKGVKKILFKFGY